VKKWKGRVRVDLRKYYEDKESGKLKPSKSGVTFSSDEWATLLQIVPAIDKELKAQAK